VVCHGSVMGYHQQDDKGTEISEGKVVIPGAYCWGGIG
jgi:hypothetical protein